MADIEELRWTKRLVANTELLMQMRAVYPAGPAHFSDNCSRYHIGALADCDLSEMRIGGGNAIGVTDLNNLAERSFAPGKDDGARGWRMHRFLPSPCKVDPVMKAALLQHRVLAPAIIAGDIEIKHGWLQRYLAKH